MQTKTIQKNIRSKMLEWLNSITDEKLRESVSKKLLVSGGSITSMFLNEKVNDYDIYIQDIDVLKKLVEYYIAPFGKDITVLDGRLRDSLITENFSDNDSYETAIGAFASSLRNLKYNQIKLFLDGGNGGLVVNEEDSETAYIPKFFSPNAISLSNDIQIVIRFWGTPEQIHETFDFIHATNYFTMNDGLVTNKDAVISILTKQLKYQGSHYPVTSVIRAKKFIKRQWNISAGELLKIMFQISQLNLSNPDVLEEQLIGVDVAYFSELIEILRNAKKGDSLTSHYINTIIDKVFGGAEDIED